MLKDRPLTKIVATLGPATETEDIIRELILAGMNVARINCSHGDWENRRTKINLIRKIAKELNRSVGILVDLQGPKIRTGTLPDEGINIKNGEKLILTINEADADYNSNPNKVFIRNYPELASELSVGQRILLDDGHLRLQVEKIQGTEVETTVIIGGILKSNKGVNLPESKQLAIKAITPKDEEDLKEAIACQADFVALSFVRQADDIIKLRQLIAAEKFIAPIKIIAKIEKPQAIECLDEILNVVDAVMVARGDLGVELEPEQVPLAQKRIIAKANQKNKIVITATQMMDSMIEHPFPTRAEVSDVANAILDGTDAVMLSGETACGKYPIETVNYMRRIALEIESGLGIKREAILPKADGEALNNLAIADAVYDLTKMNHIKTVVSLSCSGTSVQLISKFRPHARIIAATTYQHTFNYLSLVWGVTPIHFDQIAGTTDTLANLEEHLLKKSFVTEGETIVITGGLPIAARSSANFAKLHTCDGSLKKLAKVNQEAVIKDLGPIIVD